MSEAPDRIWIDKWGGNWSSAEGGTQDIEYIRKDAICVEVRPLDWDGPKCGIWDAGKRFVGDCASYKIIWDLGREETYTAYFGNKRICVRSNLEAAKAAAQEDYENRIRSALAIRTAEDVRREALVEAADIFRRHIPDLEAEGNHLGVWELKQDVANILALIDTPAPSRKEECQRCGSYGYGCYECTPEPQPTPSPEPVAWRARHSKTENWHLFEYRPSWWEAQPLYASPPTPASHAEELRKAKAEAWEAGFEAGESPVGRGHFKNPYAAAEGGE